MGEFKHPNGAGKRRSGEGNGVAESSGGRSSESTDQQKATDGTAGGGRRRFLTRTTGAAGAAVTASLGGCLGVVGQSGSPGPIRIGVLAPEPRRDPTGRSMVQSARIAAAELADRGALEGREIEVVVGDTKGSPREARRAYDRLTLSHDVDVTVGIAESTALDNVIRRIADQETLHFTTGATSVAATNLVSSQYDDYKYHFRVMLNDIQLIEVQFEFIMDMAPELGWESAAVLTEDYPWAESLANVLQDSLPELSVEYASHYPPETDDFTEIYDAVEAAGADVAWVGMAHTGDDAIVQWAADRREFAFGGIHVPMQVPRYYEMVDGACQYGITQTATTAGASISESADRFVEAYRDRYDGELPVYTGYLTYDAIRAYAKAVEIEGSFDDDALVDTLEEADIETAMGPYEFQDADGNWPHDPVMDIDDEDAAPSVFFQWQETANGDGVQEAIWPERFATATYEPPAWL